MWGLKENKKKRVTPPRICQAVPKGSVHLFFTSQVSQTRIRKERDPASTPGEGKWQGKSNASCSSWLCAPLPWLSPHLQADHPVLTSMKMQTPRRQDPCLLIYLFPATSTLPNLDLDQYTYNCLSSVSLLEQTIYSINKQSSNHSYIYLNRAASPNDE